MLNADFNADTPTAAEASTGGTAFGDEDQHPEPPNVDVNPTFPPLDSTYDPDSTKNLDINYVAMEDGADRNQDAGYAPSIVSSVMTLEGLADPAGFIIICFVVLIGDMNRGVLFPIMWPLVQELGGSSVWLGYAVASFSFGRILSSPTFGKWSIQHGYSKTLVTSTTIMLIGCISFAQVHRVGSLYFLIFSQILLGIGSGTLGVTRAYIAEITPTKDRTTYIAWLTAVQYGGFTVTPFVGSFFIYVLGDKSYEVGFFAFDQYSAAAYFMMALCIMVMFLLLTRFQARYRTKPPVKVGKKSSRRMEQDEVANRTTYFGITIYNACLAGIMILNVTTKGSIGAFETMGISYGESHFGLNPAVAGSMVALNGALGVTALLSMGQIAKFLTDVQMIVGGILVCALGIVNFAPLHSVEDGGENGLWRYGVGIFLIYGVGYPIGHTAVIGLFSKVVGRRPQGTLQGWFASAGSLARIIFPIMAGYIATYDDISSLFILLTTLLTISASFVWYNSETLAALSH